MEIRELRERDDQHLREIAGDSLADAAGDSLDEETTTTILDTLYSSEAITHYVQSEDTLFLVGENGEAPEGFVHGTMLGEDITIGAIHWLHVSPAAPDQEDVATQLLGEMVDRMRKQGAAVVRARVLAGNDDQREFFETHEFQQEATDTVDIEGTDHTELILERFIEESNEEVVEPIEVPDGQKLYVDYTGGEGGTVSPMYPTYEDEHLDQQFGWLCSNCQSMATSMDSAGRIKCPECENVRTAERWDGGYL